MKNLKTVSFAATSLAAFTLSNAQVVANVSEESANVTSDNEISLVSKSLHSGCEQPANRDYHSILGAFEGDFDEDFKFSGCGSAI